MSGAAPAEVEVVTFGCRLNLVESEAMRQNALAGGHRNLTVVNTCAVTAEAVRQARQAIRRAKRERPDRTIVVTGCAAAVEPARFAAMPEVARLVPNGVKADAATWSVDGRALSAPATTSYAHTRGFLAVQNGCDHRCTFCIIPLGRGVSRSVPVTDILAQAEALVRGGTGEIVLTGVDLTSYGDDLPGRPRLGTLVTELLAALPELPRLRLSSIDCIEADPALLDAIAREPRLMPHLHLSLQSGSNLILKRMKRRHSRADAIAFCHAVRAVRPEIVFGADFITGFPTETEADFADTMLMVEECGLTHLHVFPFSPRPDTPAARMPQVPPAIARERASRLRALGEARQSRHLEAQRGRTLTLLMERGGLGRAPDFTPVRVEAPAPAAGCFAAVEVLGLEGGTLTGHALAHTGPDP